MTVFELVQRVHTSVPLRIAYINGETYTCGATLKSQGELINRLYKDGVAEMPVLKVYPLFHANELYIESIRC